MRPSEEKERLWIRTKGQLTEAEEKQRKFNSDEAIEFLRTMGGIKSQLLVLIRNKG